MDGQSKQWVERWEQGRTCWDLKGPHPYTAKLCAEMAKLGLLHAHGSAYVPGCGHAHDAAYFAEHGFETVASDITQQAIDAAKAIYGSLKGLTLRVEDCLVTDESASYDVVFDRAMLCALEPALRPVYVQACWSRLKDGGLFLSIPFTEVRLPEKRLGPPFAVSAQEIYQLFRERFSLVWWQDYEQPSMDDLIQKEALMAWRRKPLTSLGCKA